MTHAPKLADQTASGVIEAHFNGQPNPATPIAIEYGWLWVGKHSGVAYEIMRDEEHSLFGVQCIGWSEHTWATGDHSVELYTLRFAAETEAEVRNYLKTARQRFLN